MLKKIFLMFLSGLAYRSRSHKKTLLGGFLISLGRFFSKNYIKEKKVSSGGGESLYWPLVFLYFHSRYYKEWSEGNLRDAYKFRLLSYIVIVDNLWDCWLKRQTEAYLRLCNQHFDIFSFLNSFGLEIKAITLQEVLSLPLSFNFPVNGRSDKFYSVVYGPLAEVDEFQKCSVKYETSVFIKPSEEILNALWDRAGQRYAYCNVEDFEKLSDDLAALISSGRVDGVITPREDFYNYSWALPACTFPIKFAFHSSFALINISTTLLTYRSSKVKLEGFDFYYSGTVYGRSDYHSSLRAENSQGVDMNKFLTSMAKHDLLINYLIIKELVAKGMIQPDEGLHAALDNDPVDYLVAIERKYAPSRG